MNTVAVLQKLLTISLIIFMAGNLLELGLRMRLRDVAAAFANVKFVTLGLLWSFVLGPALAVLITKVIPLAEPYRIGFLFLGMAPCAPFLPVVARRAQGSDAHVAAIMLLTAMGTVGFMPLAIPIIIAGFSADAWMIARPLVFYMVIPLSIGVAVRLASESWAELIHPIVRKITGIDSLTMAVLVGVIYGHDFISSLGSFAIVAQLLFYTIITMVSYGFSFGLPPAQRSVLALGMCTRNIGAAIAPLLFSSGVDRQAIVMCALAVPLTVIVALLSAKSFARRN